MINLALVGIGYWASHVAEEILKSKKVNLYKVFTRTIEKRNDFAEKYGCLAAESFKEILEDPIVDGIVLETPNYVHTEQLLSIAKYKKAVLVDKPICNTLEEAKMIYEVYRGLGTVLAVGHNSRRRLESRKMKSLIKEKKFGEIVAIDSVISTPRGLGLKKDDWRGNYSKCPGGPLLQLAVHHADTLVYLMGPVSEVIGFQVNRLKILDTFDTSTTLLKFHSKCLGYIGSCYNTINTYKISIYGTNGKIVYDDVDGLSLYDISGRRSFISLDSKSPADRVSDAIYEEIEEFADSIQGKATPETGLNEAIYALAIVNAALLSNETGKLISMENLLQKYQLNLIP